MNVVLVEDDQIDAMAVRRAMGAVNAQFELHHERSAADALAHLRGDPPRPPTVLIVDLHMPGMDGLTLLREIRADGKLTGLPTFVLSTSSDHADRTAAAELHVAGWVTKSADGSRLRAFMRMLDLYGQVVTAG